MFESPSLNDFLALGRPSWPAVRSWLTELLTHPGYADVVEPHLIDRSEVRLHLPVEVGDYVDFYASEHHASNVGRIFRPDVRAADAELAAPADRLPRPRRHPRGLRHRRRPTARTAPTSRDAEHPSSGPAPGWTSRPRWPTSSAYQRIWASQVGVDDFADHVFGVCLLNDWSARDIQAWEYVPLGPFLGKSFGTSLSPWVVPLDGARRRAGRPARAGSASRCPTCAAPPGTARVRPRPAAGGPGQRHARRPAAVRHDVLVAGADAGAPDGQRRQPAHRRRLRLRHGLRPRAGPAGSLLELTWNGTEPLTLDDGTPARLPAGRRRGRDHRLGPGRGWRPARVR